MYRVAGPGCPEDLTAWSALFVSKRGGDLMMCRQPLFDAEGSIWPKDSLRCCRLQNRKVVCQAVVYQMAS